MEKPAVLTKQFRVVRKFREETEKGFKYGMRLANTNNDSLTVYFESETDLDAYDVQDDVTVKIGNPQTTLA